MTAAKKQQRRAARKRRDAGLGGRPLFHRGVNFGPEDTSSGSALVPAVYKIPLTPPAL